MILPDIQSFSVQRITFGISNLTELPNISDELIERLNENIENDNVEEDGQLTFGDDISL